MSSHPRRLLLGDLVHLHHLVREVKVALLVAVLKEIKWQFVVFASGVELGWAGWPVDL